MPDAPETVLVFSGIGVPSCSCRGATQTLEPIGQADAGIFRTINGGLRNVADATFRKYRSVITCSDMLPLAIDGVWPGQLLDVDCISLLVYPTAGSPDREVVEGSELVRADGFTAYRPRLAMMVMGFALREDEYGAVSGWTMTLEEV